MEKLLTSNDWQWRLIRTIIQGILGVLCANLDLLLGFAAISPEIRAMIVALVMAILSPIMALLGDKTAKVDETDEGGTE